MVRALMLRGAGVGALAGLVAFLVARVFAEPVIQAAIDYESGRDEAKAALEGGSSTTSMAGMSGMPGMADADSTPELFSRTVQGNLGIGAGMIVFGVAVGLFFAVGFCMAYGRTGNVRPRQLSLLVALFGFLGFYLVPFLKYPANPPSIGNPNTIGDRSGLYLLMIVVSVLVLVLAVVVGQRLQARLGTWSAALVAGAGAVVVLGAVMALLPSLGELAVNVAQNGPQAMETPQPLRDPAGTIVYPGFDADVLYQFRLASVGAQALLWGVLGFGFAPLVERVLLRHGVSNQRDLARTTG